MELSRETLESIGHYVRGNLRDWLREEATADLPVLLERSVRIEEELKAQRELMQQGFGHLERSVGLMERRFEQVDKRFEQSDKRLEDLRLDMNARFQEMHGYTTRWFTVISVVLVILSISGIANIFLG